MLAQGPAQWLKDALTDVMTVLIVQETPEDGDQSIKDSHSTIEGQLGDLSGLKLAVGVAVLDNGIVFLGVVLARQDTVVTGLLDGIVDRGGLVEVDSLGEDQSR
jgi:hypothetical protein